jgi:hypothetical protein
MNIVRWEPFGDFVSLRQAMDRLFEDSFVKPAHSPILGNCLKLGDTHGPPAGSILHLFFSGLH